MGLIIFLLYKYLGSYCHFCENSNSFWFTRYIIYISYIYMKYFKSFEPVWTINRGLRKIHMQVTFNFSFFMSSFSHKLQGKQISRGNIGISYAFTTTAAKISENLIVLLQVSKVITMFYLLFWILQLLINHLFIHIFVVFLISHLLSCIQYLSYSINDDVSSSDQLIHTHTHCVYMF